MLYTEEKNRPDGRQHQFACDLVAKEDGLVVLRFAHTRDNTVGPLYLPFGAQTLAFYWQGRPYNLYWWLTADGRTLGYYFNLGDQLAIGEESLSWRDLWVDILVIPGQGPCILDEEEVTPEARTLYGDSIDQAKAEVLSQWPKVAAEAAAVLNRYLPGLAN